MTTTSVQKTNKSVQIITVNHIECIFSLQGGIYIFNLLNWYSASYSLLVLGMLELVMVSWLYGNYVHVCNIYHSMIYFSRRQIDIYICILLFLENRLWHFMLILRRNFA